MLFLTRNALSSSKAGCSSSKDNHGFACIFWRGASDFWRGTPLPLQNHVRPLQNRFTASSNILYCVTAPFSQQFPIQSFCPDIWWPLVRSCQSVSQHPRHWSHHVPHSFYLFNLFRTSFEQVHLLSGQDWFLKRYAPISSKSLQNNQSFFWLRMKSSSACSITACICSVVGSWSWISLIRTLSSVATPIGVVIPWNANCTSVRAMSLQIRRIITGACFL